MQPSEKMEEIVAEYSPRLLGYIRLQVKCREDAEDILQDVFYQLARASAGGGGGIGRVSSWLYRVARNAVLNFWRKKRELSFDTEDEVCEEMARTLFCAPQDAPTRYICANWYGRNLTSPFRSFLRNSVRCSV